MLRCDLNVPLKGLKVQDSVRIQASLRSIRYLQEKQARIALLSHLGRPKGRVIEELRLAPVAEKLSELLDTKVRYARDCIGEEAQKSVHELKPGQVLLLENLRFHEGESKNDPAFAEKLASVGGKKADYFINDAFGAAHRSHASTVGLAKLLKSAAGYLMQSEIKNLEKIRTNAKKPLLILCGGVKVSDKIGLIQSLLKKSERLLIGGAMAFTFLRAKGLKTGKSFVEEKEIGRAEKILKEYKEKICLPIDFMCAPLFDLKKGQLGPLKAVPKEKIPNEEYALDIGPKSIAIFEKFIAEAKTIFWNGPMGVFELEQTSQGTLSIARAIGKQSEQGAFSVVGGGDSIAALGKTGLSNKVSYISTGGGASLQFLEDPNLPGLCALNDSSS